MCVREGGSAGERMHLIMAIIIIVESKRRISAALVQICMCGPRATATTKRRAFFDDIFSFAPDFARN